MIIGRRGFIAGLGALIAAPAIVRASSLMPIRALLPIRNSIWLVQWGKNSTFSIYPEIVAPDMMTLQKWSELSRWAVFMPGIEPA